MKKARVIAFYLPQFHPVPENDLWWGKGFTEWTNVAKAKPQFRGHVQPKIPADLGFYDLRMPETRQAQADMARDCGIEGFCYWHYWFGNGKRILEMPFNEVLKTGKPDFPFCLGWANHSWSTKTWETNKAFQKDKIFLEQTYGDVEDYKKHFEFALTAFRDERYITVDGKPLFLIFAPDKFPDIDKFIKLWNELAIENGLKGIHFVGTLSSVGRFDQGVRHDYLSDAKSRYEKLKANGFDAINSSDLRFAEIKSVGMYRKMFDRLFNHIFTGSRIEKYDYKKIIKNFFIDEDKEEWVYPTIIPRWDKTPRVGRRAYMYTGTTPELFEQHVRDAVDIVKDKEPEHRIIFLKSWNEWGEGNFMEPDLEFGHGFLDALKNVICED